MLCESIIELTALLKYVVYRNKKFISSHQDVLARLSSDRIPSRSDVYQDVSTQILVNLLRLAFGSAPNSKAASLAYIARFICKR
jgi:hypothetical protein